MADGKSEKSIADVAADLAILRDDISKMSSTLNDLLRQQVDATGDQVRSALGSARDTIASSAHEASAGVRLVSADIEKAIEKNPITAVLIAAIVGLFLGNYSRNR